jgi:hypothetical protein
MKLQPSGEVVLFFRGNHFYPIQFMGIKPAEIEVQDHVALNPEIIRVERINGEVLWERAER